MMSWNVWLVPARMPNAVIAKLYTAAHQAVHTPKVREILEAGGYERFANTPAEARKFLRSEIKTYAEIVRAAGVHPE